MLLGVCFFCLETSGVYLELSGVYLELPGVYLGFSGLSLELSGACLVGVVHRFLSYLYDRVYCMWFGMYHLWYVLI